MTTDGPKPWRGLTVPSGLHQGWWRVRHLEVGCLTRTRKLRLRSVLVVDHQGRPGKTYEQRRWAMTGSNARALPITSSGLQRGGVRASITARREQICSVLQLQADPKPPHQLTTLLLDVWAGLGHLDVARSDP